MLHLASTFAYPMAPSHSAPQMAPPLRGSRPIHPAVASHTPCHHIPHATPIVSHTLRLSHPTCPHAVSYAPCPSCHTFHAPHAPHVTCHISHHCLTCPTVASLMPHHLHLWPSCCTWPSSRLGMVLSVPLQHQAHFIPNCKYIFFTSLQLSYPSQCILTGI